VWDQRADLASPMHLTLRIAEAPFPFIRGDTLDDPIDYGMEAFEIAVRSSDGDPNKGSRNVFALGPETDGTIQCVPMTAKSTLDRGVLTVRVTANRAGVEFRATDRYTVSADGQTLTLSESSRLGSAPEQNSTRLFDRQSEASWEAEQQ